MSNAAVQSASDEDKTLNVILLMNSLWRSGQPNVGKSVVMNLLTEQGYGF